MSVAVTRQAQRCHKCATYCNLAVRADGVVVCAMCMAPVRDTKNRKAGR